jgi:uncharacterized membrane protein
MRKKMTEEKKTASKNTKSFKVAMTAITAALYIALGYAFQPISFMGLQFRVAELMVGMCILFPVPGLIGNVIGVFILNLSSPLGPLDFILGPLINIPALGMIIACDHMCEEYEKYFGGIAYAAFISAYVSALLNWVLGLSLELMFIQVFISEAILATLGIALFSKIKERLGGRFING